LRELSPGHPLPRMVLNSICLRLAIVGVADA
jgi:hypothetical protein